MPNIPNNGDGFAGLRAALQNTNDVLNNLYVPVKKKPKIVPQDDFARSLTPEQRGEKRGNVWLDPEPPNHPAIADALRRQAEELRGQAARVAAAEPFVWRREPEVVEPPAPWEDEPIDWGGNERR